MNTSTISETKPSSSLKTTLFKTLPDTLVGRLFFWGAVPSLLLLFTVGVGFLSSSVFSPYLPFLALLGGAACLRWRTLGVSCSYVALTLLVVTHYSEMAPDERLRQMGVVFTLAVDFFILLLVTEEIEGLISQFTKNEKVKTAECNQAQLQLQQVGEEKEELRKRLEAEIQQLKEEAEQRRIERARESKRIELIQSEIEMLTAQKTEFVEKAKEAQCILEKERAAEAEIDLAERKVTELTEELRQLRASEEELREKLTKIEPFRAEALSAKEALQQLRASEEELREKLAEVEPLKGEVAQLKITQREALSAKEALQERVAVLSQELEQAKRGEAVEADVAALRESLSKAESEHRESLLATQRAIMTLQVSPVIKMDDAKIRELEGLLKQIRSQFAEKSQVLNQTRKELFQVQEKLIAVEHERDLAKVAPEREEGAYYESEINRLTEEILSLEEEIELLESLVFKS